MNQPSDQHEPLPFTANGTPTSDGFPDADPFAEDLAGLALDPRDELALEALLEAGFDVDAVSDPALRPRVLRTAQVLGLLETDVFPADPALVDLAMVRIARVREPALSRGDLEALDALAHAGWQADRVAPSALRPRARRHEALLLAATDAQARASDDLVERTMRAIDAATQQSAPIPIERARRRVTARLQDVVSVAAVFLLVASVLWPVMGSLREDARRAICNGNFAAAGMGLGSYASFSDGQLPMASAGLGGAPWWNVGQGPEQSNSANLFMLPRTGFVPLSQLACPGNSLAPTALAEQDTDWRRLDEVSYSYRIMFGPSRPDLHTATRFVVLVDRSPVVLRAIAGNPVDPLENSPNHGGRGQHVLWNDGSAQWTESPELPTGDNLWLPREIEDEIRRLQGKPRRIDPISGTELPGSVGDAFVGP